MVVRRSLVVGLAWLVGCSDDGVAATAGESGSTSTVSDASTSAASTSASTSGLSADGGSTSSTETTADSSSSSGTTGDSSTSSTASSSGVVDESSSTGAGTDSSSGGATDGATDGSTDASTDASTGEPDALPNGAACDLDLQCVSSFCFVVGPLGGICGECEADTDCDAGGCSVPLPLAMPPEGAVCNDGSLGDGCDTDAACADALVCALIIDVPGVLTNETCGECAIDADCGPAEVCSPAYDVPVFGGAWTCAGEGTLPNGSGCRLDGLGPAACASGICTPGDVLGLLELGVCGACQFDIECPMGQTCQPAQVDFQAGLEGSFCA
jgi:hypothetical protein